MTKHKIGFVPYDNAFLKIDNVDKAQQLADQLPRYQWRRFLDALAKRVNPLLKGLLKGDSYYWVTDQAEFATDVLFKSREHLQPLYGPGIPLAVRLPWIAFGVGVMQCMPRIGRTRVSDVYRHGRCSEIGVC
jgi:hypothetical protein